MSRLRSRDSALADDLQIELDDLRDEVVYLKVKLRKEGSVKPDGCTCDVRVASVAGHPVLKLVATSPSSERRLDVEHRQRQQ